jgi:hypothetical protein
MEYKLQRDDHRRHISGAIVSRNLYMSFARQARANGNRDFAAFQVNRARKVSFAIVCSLRAYRIAGGDWSAEIRAAKAATREMVRRLKRGAR